MTRKYIDGTMFTPIRSGRICPVCGSRAGRCSMMHKDGTLYAYICKNSVSGKEMKNLPGWYMHLVSEKITEDKFVNVESLKRTADKDVCNKVYSHLLKVIKRRLGPLGLYKEDLDSLLKRGISKEEIEYMKLFSIPRDEHRVMHNGIEMKLKTSICKELVEVFGAETVIGVPGFEVVNNKFITLRASVRKNGSWSSASGFYVPYIDEENRIQSLQMRLDEPVVYKNKPLRYFWLSSKQISSGAPIDIFVAPEKKRKDLVIITEGGLKGKIAATKLGCKAISMPGISCYDQILQTVDKDPNNKYFLCFDMDKYKNPDVLKAEQKLLSILLGRGVSVRVLEWENGKGIDDAIMLNSRFKLKV